MSYVYTAVGYKFVDFEEPDPLEWPSQADFCQLALERPDLVFGDPEEQYNAVQSGEIYRCERCGLWTADRRVVDEIEWSECFHCRMVNAGLFLWMGGAL